jgi:Sensors of blue-light using FAD
MLTRMIYVSTAVGPVTTAVTGTILRSAQAHNAAHGITGVLCQGQGAYLQVLEGERSKLDALYARILADKRHQQIELRQVQDITRRRYGKWSMAHVDLAQADVQMAASLPSFDPGTRAGEQVMAKIDSLIAAGTVISAPVV